MILNRSGDIEHQNKLMIVKGLLYKNINIVYYSLCVPTDTVAVNKYRRDPPGTAHMYVFLKST